jgi:hypothetical protein
MIGSVRTKTKLVFRPTPPNTGLFTPRSGNYVYIYIYIYVSCAMGVACGGCVRSFYPPISFKPTSTNFNPTLRNDLGGVAKLGAKAILKDHCSLCHFTKSADFINPSIHKFISGYIHKPINSSIHRFTHPSIHKSINSQIHEFASS